MALWKEGEVHAEYGFPVKTLQRWRLDGDGPPYVKVGRGVRYRPEAIERWLDENTRVGKPQGAA